MTLVVGTKVNGAQRWLGIPGLGFRFQPGELAKCVTLIAVADWLSRQQDRREITTPRTLQAAGLALVPGGPARAPAGSRQRRRARRADGAAALHRGHAAGPASSCPASRASRSSASTSCQSVRDAARDWASSIPSATPSAPAGSSSSPTSPSAQGGCSAQGLGNSRQKLDYLPEAHTDFVLALVAEELGLVGVLVVIGAFAALWISGTRVARRARDKFDMLCGFAMVALLTIPAFLNAVGRDGARADEGADAALPLLRPDLARRQLLRARHPARRRAAPSGEPRAQDPGGDMARRWVITGGGTGGHVTPALALGEAIVDRGDEVLFIGSSRGPRVAAGAPTRASSCACSRASRSWAAALARPAARRALDRAQRRQRRSRILWQYRPTP